MRAVRKLSLGLLVLLGRRPFRLVFRHISIAAQQNEILLQQLQRDHGLTDDQVDANPKNICRVTALSGQGNPAVTRHPVTPEEVQVKLKQSGIHYENPRFERICRAKYMAPLYNPSKEKPEDAKAASTSSNFPTFHGLPSGMGQSP